MFHDINFSLSSAGVLLLFYIARKRHAGKANHRPHETAHHTRSPLAHAESFARKNNTAPTNEEIRRGGVESFGAQCTQKIGKVRTQSR